MTGPKLDTAAVRTWLRILHHGAPGRIHIAATGAWSGPSFDTDDIDAAVSRVEQLDAGRPLGIYARITTLRGPLKRGERGGNADSLALPALWADLDIAGPGHKDQNLPPDWAAAQLVVTESGLPEPTLWVDSGHGAYPMWMLDRAVVLGDGDHELADAVALSANWQKVIGAAHARLGWHYGQGVGDLARVLRIPGTVNRKAGSERQCKIVAGSGLTFGMEELLTRCSDGLDAIAATGILQSQPTLGRPITMTPGDWTAAATARPAPVAGAEVSPGDDFNDRVTWPELLEPHGWRLVRRRGDIADWCRPGKDDGISATTNAMGTDRLHVFSTSTEFDTTSYTKFGAFAVLEHRGDHSAAAAALKARGYGRAGTSIEDYLGGLSDTLPPLSTPRPDVTQPSSSDAPVVQPEILDARTLAELRYRQEVAAEARRVAINWEGRRMAETERFRTTWREPPFRPSLVDELALPDPPITYRVDKLLTVDGNAVLTAAFKAGKTTMCNNLLRSLADGEPFLNRFDIAVPDGRIAAFNYEVSEGQYRSWLRRIGIRDLDRICVVNLRGFRLPLTDPQVEDWITKLLIERNVKTWVVDPFARAMVGCGDENSNTDVGVVLDALDVIKGRAGVQELILPTHTGRAEQIAGAERARGATRLDDWADARWLLTTDDSGRRFFRANGRDVDVGEELLSFDDATGRLTMGGHDRRGMARRDHDAELVEWIREHPGLGKTEIAEQMGRNRNRLFDQLDAAVAARSIYRVPAPTGRNKMLHYVTGTVSAAVVDSAE